MGNKQEVPSFYNKDFVKKDSRSKKGKDREIKEDPTPKTYYLPNLIRNDKFVYLKIITWNLNMEAHSSYATDDWIKTNDKWDRVYQQCIKQNADIISFQELPKAYYGLNHNKDTHPIHPLIQRYIDTNKWYITFSPSSHCGYTIILINKRLQNTFDIIYNDDIDPNKSFPSVILTSKTEQKNNEQKSEDNKLILFGCHLHPWKGEVNASKRRKEFDRLYSISVSKQISDYFVIIGDMNMRDNEEIDIIKQYNGKLSCCWNIVPNEYKNNSMFTWYRNYFEVGANGVSRFDKVFYGAKIKCVQVSVFDECVSDDKYQFLSDHRGVSVLLEIQ